MRSCEANRACWRWGGTWIVLLALLSLPALAQQPSAPHIGYVFPAGGQRGTEIDVIVGGQQLWGAWGAHVSGDGVTVSDVEHQGVTGRIQYKHVREIQRLIIGHVKRRIEAMPPGNRPRLPDGFFSRAGQPPEEPVELPDHPLIQDLDKRTLEELREISEWFRDRKNLEPPQRAIAETVSLRVTIAADAEPGLREIRVITGRGPSVPIPFYVDRHPEIREVELNDSRAMEREPLVPPVVINGQIGPGDVDRFRIRAEEGDRLVLRAQARELVPYLADAVPGWFQAVVAVYDESGQEVAYVDDFRHRPDPALLFEAPRPGEYEVMIRDSIYRGREDFVYRLSIAEGPFITSVYPAGGTEGKLVSSHVDGWNLPTDRIQLDTNPGGATIRPVALSAPSGSSNPVPVAVGDLPETEEAEPNGSPDDAQLVQLPLVINGRIESAGDADVYRFGGQAGNRIIAEVTARRLDSPLDSVVYLVNPSGEVLAWNDDFKDPAHGLVTHHADSYVSAELPADGMYCLRIADAQARGGSDFTYRLRLGPPQPSFELRAVPSSLAIPAGGAGVLEVHAHRIDGFEGPIELRLTDAPEGFRIDGGVIPSGTDRLSITVSAPRPEGPRIAAIDIQGQAQVDGQTVARPVVAADDMMQAFIYHHLVPRMELVTMVLGDNRAPFPEIAHDAPIDLPVGGRAEVVVDLPGRGVVEGIHFELRDPPTGVSLVDVRREPAKVTLVLACDAAREEAFSGNIIADAYIQNPIRDDDGNPTGRTRKVPLGSLPAIPARIGE